MSESEFNQGLRLNTHDLVSGLGVSIKATEFWPR